MIYWMFAMILPTATALVILFGSRIRAVRAAEAAARYFRIYQGETEPEETAKPALHFSNPFQTPVLFCAASLLTTPHRSPGSSPGFTRPHGSCMHASMAAGIDWADGSTRALPGGSC